MLKIKNRDFIISTKKFLNPRCNFTIGHLPNRITSLDVILKRQTRRIVTFKSLWYISRFFIFCLIVSWLIEFFLSLFLSDQVCIYKATHEAKERIFSNLDPIYSTTKVSLFVLTTNTYKFSLNLFFSLLFFVVSFLFKLNQILSILYIEKEYSVIWSIKKKSTH